jgi:hypothetical protein
MVNRLKRRHIIHQQVYESANEKHNDLSPHSSENIYYQIDKKKITSRIGMWRKWSPEHCGGKVN